MARNQHFVLTSELISYIWQKRKFANLCNICKIWESPIIMLRDPNYKRGSKMLPGGAHSAHRPYVWHPCFRRIKELGLSPVIISQSLTYCTMLLKVEYGNRAIMLSSLKEKQDNKRMYINNLSTSFSHPCDWWSVMPFTLKWSSGSLRVQINSLILFKVCTSRAHIPLDWADQAWERAGSVVLGHTVSESSSWTQSRSTAPVMVLAQVQVDT